MKKSKNIKWIVLVSILIVSAIVILFVTSNSDDSVQEELLFECDKSVPLEEKMQNDQKMKLYKKGNNLELVQSSYFHLFINPSEEQMDLAFKLAEQNLKIRINNKFGEDTSDVKFDSKRENKDFYFDIIYKINENNSKDMEDYFDIDLYNSEIEEAINYFEGEGFTCKKY